MPIYEFACPACRKIYSFLSKRLNPDHVPTCPKCGNKNLIREMSRFSALRGMAETSGAELSGEDAGMPDVNDPRISQSMAELERDMAHLDENNPRHLAHVMKKMKELMPSGSLPKDVDVAIRRLEAGESPEKIEEDMGDVLDGLMGEDGKARSGNGGYAHDSGLYDY
jgi:putative FmdB family regulatory protein